MHKLKQFTFALAAVCALSTACGQSGTAETTSASAAETKAETTVETTAAVESKAAVASGNETAAEQTIDTVGLVPVSAADLKEGTYDISVESSSSMFKIISCALTVKEGAMTARMTMGGTGYLYVYMGTGEEASKVPESDLISFEENSDGTHSFTVPVETLNEVLPCTAFSKKKEKWYDRELVFEASGIPADAFLNTSLKTVEDLGLRPCVCGIPGGGRGKGRKGRSDDHLEQLQLRLYAGGRGEVSSGQYGGKFHLCDHGDWF